MKIAVTGGAGFIGSRLVEKLEGEHEVKVIDNLSSGKEDNIPDGAELEKIDIKNREDTVEALKGFDSIFHFAANPKVNTFPYDRNKEVI